MVRKSTLRALLYSFSSFGIFFFFFSSRRRHTRCLSDWSSDVCSSDLSPNNPTGNTVKQDEVITLLKTGKLVIVDEAYYEFFGESVISLVSQYENLIKIGRASCRERV